MTISRTGNRDNEFYQIQSELDSISTELSSIDGRVTTLEATSGGGGGGGGSGGDGHSIPAVIEVTASDSPALADIDQDAVFTNVGTSDYTITLPSTIPAGQIGKRFHFVASATWGNALTVTCPLVGVMRDDSNTSAPYTVNNGTLTVTVAKGLFPYYSVSGTYS